MPDKPLWLDRLAEAESSNRPMNPGSDRPRVAALDRPPTRPTTAGAHCPTPRGDQPVCVAITRPGADSTACGDGGERPPCRYLLLKRVIRAAIHLLPNCRHPRLLAEPR
jgi:hypothetical protein